MSLLPLISKCEGQAIRKEAKVLEEDFYMENLGKIIVRDFFPDLPALKAKLDPDFDPVKDKDAQSVCATPSQFGSPASSVGCQSLKQTPAKPFQVEEVERLTDAQLEKMSLNKYLSNYTSEDNASFNEIMKEVQRKHMEKHAWMYKDEQLQIEDNPDKKKQLTWNYVPLNSLMYIPDGVDLSESEKLQKYSLKKQTVCPENTRFTVQPYDQPTQAMKSTINRMEGRIGLDGKEIMPTNTPKMGGYGFMGTPSPAPGVDASPLMTWGDIEGTPCRIDGPQTPRPGGPTFKIPDLPTRDKLLHKLTDDLNKSHRTKKAEALRQAAATFSNSPRSLMSRTEKIQSMSPAAQRLMSGKLRINTNSPFDKPVTPSPIRTPVSTPTPKASPRLDQGAPKKRSALPSDDLLKLPLKKAKASDFF